MSRFHEEQHFHDALMGLLVLAMIFIVGVTVLAVVLSRPNDALLLATAPVVVVLVAALISLSHLDVDVTDSGVSIAFRHLWPRRRIAFGDIVGLEVKHYRPLIDYGGWGVRLGPAGWAYTTGGDVGVKLRLRKGLLGRVQLRGPDFSRIVLHPAGLGKDLTEFFLGQRDDAPAVVEHDGARAGGALIERQNVLHAGHQVLYSSAAITPPITGPTTGIHA